MEYQLHIALLLLIVLVFGKSCSMSEGAKRCLDFSLSEWHTGRGRAEDHFQPE